MPGEITLESKYERNHWPSISRPDRKPPDGWSLPLITSVNRIHNHSLSPDGRTIAFIWDREDLSDIYIMPSAGGWPARITTDRPAFQYWWEETPRFSPDGKWLAFCIRGVVHVTALEEGWPRKVSDFTSDASAPMWMPDSDGLIISVERNENTKLLLTNRQGDWPRAITSGTGDDMDPRPAPDGRSVVFVHQPAEKLDSLLLYLVDVSSGKKRLLTGPTHSKDWSPRWSPDGTQIAFLSKRSGFHEIWLISRQGGEPRQLTRAEADFSDINWSPDGHWLIATLNRGGALDLVQVNTQNGAIRDLRVGAGCHMRPRFSPKGDFITVEYTSPTLPPDLYRIRVDLNADGLARKGDVTQLTSSNPPALARLPLVVPERVKFASYDRLEIPALLYRPKKPNGAAILHPHGGPRDQYYMDWDIHAQYLAAQGYTFLAINYRGGTGYGTTFEYLNQHAWGIGDTQDCLYGARYLAELPEIDPHRIGILGASYGGYLVACCLSWDPDHLFACGVSFFGDADLFSSWAQCDRSTRLYTEMQLGHPAANRQIYRDGSPIFDVDNVQAPVLILHGLNDRVVPTEASEEWVEALRRADKTYEYKTYPGESHGFLHRENIIDAYTRVDRFLAWYLMP